jgi:hypothetical protein
LDLLFCSYLDQIENVAQGRLQPRQFLFSRLPLCNVTATLCGPNRPRRRNFFDDFHARLRAQAISVRDQLRPALSPVT